MVKATLRGEESKGPMGKDTLTSPQCVLAALRVLNWGLTVPSGQVFTVEFGLPLHGALEETRATAKACWAPPQGMALGHAQGTTLYLHRKWDHAGSSYSAE